MTRRTLSGERRTNGSANALAQGLGWFSIGLGLIEVLQPGALARSLGMRGSESVLRSYGMREIATGIGILASRDPTPWIWGRVAGDALDLATLAGGLRGDNPRKQNVGLALAAVAGATALDLYCAQSLTNGARTARPSRPIRDYSGRSGLPRPPHAMRGAARDFEAPRDMRIPAAMRPYSQG